MTTIAAIRRAPSLTFIGWIAVVPVVGSKASSRSSSSIRDSGRSTDSIPGGWPVASRRCSSTRGLRGRRTTDS